MRKGESFASGALKSDEAARFCQVVARFEFLAGQASIATRFWRGGFRSSG